MVANCQPFPLSERQALRTYLAAHANDGAGAIALFLSHLSTNIDLAFRKDGVEIVRVRYAKANLTITGGKLAFPITYDQLLTLKAATIADGAWDFIFGNVDGNGKFTLGAIGDMTGSTPAAAINYDFAAGRGFALGSNLFKVGFPFTVVVPPASGGTPISLSDSRIFNVRGPTMAWNSNPNDQKFDSRYQADQQLNCSAMVSQPRYLSTTQNGQAWDGTTHAGGGWSLVRGWDPAKPTKRAYYHRIGPEMTINFSNTFRAALSNYGEQIHMRDTIWTAHAFRFEPSCCRSTQGWINMLDWHTSSGALAGGGDIPGGGWSPFAIFLTNGSTFSFSRRVFAQDGQLSHAGVPHSQEVFLSRNRYPGVWYTFICKMKPSPYSEDGGYMRVWLAEDDGPLVELFNYVAPWGVVAENDMSFIKHGLYSWDYPWYSGNGDKAEMWSRGFVMLKANGSGDETPENLRATLEALT